MRLGTTRSRGLAAAFAAATLVAAVPARADVIDEVSKQLIKLEAEAGDLERGLSAPKPRGEGDDTAQRRLIEAQVAYGRGLWAEASIMLYDIVEKHPRSRVYREAVFYLADSLHQRHDFLSARDYFKEVVLEFGEGDKHYQEALQRLIELSLRLHDDTDVKDWLARLDRIPQGQRSDAAPYVRGKYAYFSGNHDEALTLFGNIAKGSKYYFQARYFMGTAHVARKDLAPAAKVFGELLKEPARTKAEKRIVELAHLALGRLHYEREQLSEAVDEYLKIGRRSDLFDDALFEVSWVYVKAKQFDKALRALELLALANPKSAMLPDVRILEGNLRIRKAQSLVTTGHGNSAEEYAKAVDVFEKTRDAYVQPREELQKLMEQQADPKRFFAQITGQSLESFDTEIALPQMAAAWVREEPEVGRVVTVTGDLGKIRTELDETGALLDRLERAVTSPSRVNIFPELADRRARAKELSEANFGLRQQIATHERALVGRYASESEKAELDTLRQRRLDLAQQLAGMPNAADSFSERVAKAKQNYVDLDKKAQEVEVLIFSVEAELVAVQKYYHDAQEKKIPPEQYDASVKELAQLVADLRTELAAIRAETSLAMDEAGISDDLAREEASMRKQLDQAVRAEHEAMQRIVGRMGGGDRTKADQIGSLLGRGAAIDATVDRTNAKIDRILDQQLAEIKVAVVEERTRLAEYRTTLEAYEVENVEVGSTVIAGSFDGVVKKFYDIGVRADLGVVDVAWAQNEEAKDRVNRLNLDSSREKKVLLEEFREILAEDPADAPPAPAPQPTPTPAPEGDDDGQ